MQARKDRLIGRTSLALGLGISTDRLFSYEKGRAKLPWLVGNKACEIMNISQAWLAGRTDERGIYIWDEKLDDLLDPDIGRLPFSEVYADRLAPRMVEKRIPRKDILTIFGTYVADIARQAKEAKDSNRQPSEALLGAINQLRQMHEQARSVLEKWPGPPHSDLH